MANGLTIDQLYESFMDIDPEGEPLDVETPFAEDVFDFFGRETLVGLAKEDWASEYGMYLPTFDPAQIHLAERERDIDYRDAMSTLKATQAATDSVYSTELDTLSTALGREMTKGREVAGRTGLRSGSLESAIEDTIKQSGNKAEDLGDRFRISGTETKDKYNIAMVDAALDYDKTVEREKEDFYDRTMAAIMRLMDKGAFAKPGPLESGVCWEGADVNYFEDCSANCAATYSNRTEREDCVVKCKNASGATIPDYGVDADGNTTAECP